MTSARRSLDSIVSAYKIELAQTLDAFSEELSSNGHDVDLSSVREEIDRIPIKGARLIVESGRYFANEDVVCYIHPVHYRHIAACRKSLDGDIAISREIEGIIMSYDPPEDARERIQRLFSRLPLVVIGTTRVPCWITDLESAGFVYCTRAVRARANLNLADAIGVSVE